MEISVEKTKLMTSSTDSIQIKTTVGRKLKQVAQFKYVGVIISKNGSKPEILARAAHTVSAMGTEV